MQKVEHKTAPVAAYNGSIPDTPIRFIWYTAKPHMWLGFSVIAAVVFAQTLGALMPYLISLLIDGVVHAATKSEQLYEMRLWGSVFVVGSFFLYGGWRVAGLIGAVFTTRQNKTASAELLKYMVGHSHVYFSDRFAGSVSNKISNAGDGSSRLTERFFYGVLPQIILTIVLGIILGTIHYMLSVLFFVVIVGTVILNIFLVGYRRPYVIEYWKTSSIFRGEVVDLITNIQATRQYVQTNGELERTGERIEERREKDLKQWRIGEYINIVNNGLAVFLTIIILVVTYVMLQNGTASIGDLVLVMLTMFRISGALVHIGEIMNGVIRLYGETEEGLQDLIVSHGIVDVNKDVLLSVQTGKIQWNKVNFEFGENAVFKDFDLHIQSGQRIGLVGPSGAGKTTFVSLLLRQHDLESGSILIDDQNIAEVTQDSLRENIAVVPQEPLLFHRSVRENIAYGKSNVTDEEIIAVAKKAQAHDFIMELEKGYETHVGERGIKLSGGQKQRVAIARAMLKDAPILVLDEATSALDSESEVEIQKALYALMEGKTVIAIAHRLSTLREMDRILVMEKGKIQEDGTHDELTKAGGTYARLWEHQAGGFLQA